MSTRKRQARLVLCSALLLFSTGCTAFRELGETITGEPKKKAALFQSPRPDDRRDALLFFTDHEYGREEKYTRLYQQMRERIVVHDLDYYTLTNAVLTTRLPERVFYERYAGLLKAGHARAKI